MGKSSVTVQKTSETIQAITVQKKWKSKYFWAAIVAIIAFALGNWGLYDYIGLASETFQKLIDLIFVAITALGIWNDAGNAENF